MVTGTTGYAREVPTRTIDVYRVLRAFDVTDPCLQHAIKKLLCAGNRRGGKTQEEDVSEAIEALARWQEMQREDTGP